MIWEDRGNDLEEWLEKVFSSKNKPTVDLVIREEDIG